jgi:putative lipoprotein
LRVVYAGVVPRRAVPYHAASSSNRTAPLKKTSFAIALVALLSACANHDEKHADKRGTVSGSADLTSFYEVPSDATFVAILEDVSQADVAAKELGRARLEPAGQPPFRFEIDYDRNLIDPRHSYTVRARLSSGERILLTSDTAYPVLTQGAGDKVHMLLKQP